MTGLREFTRDFHSILSASCVADDSRSAELLQVLLLMGCPCIQLTSSSSSAPRVRLCRQSEVPDQLPIVTSHSVTKPAEPFLDHLRRYSNETEAAIQSRRLVCIECGGYCYYQRPLASFRPLIVLATTCYLGAESNVLLPSRPCPFDATNRFCDVACLSEIGKSDML